MSGRFAATHDHVRIWLSDYERAWRAPGTALARDLFSEDASYQLAPYDPPIVGGAAIADMWERERQGPDEQFTMESEIVAVEGDTAVVRVWVAYSTGTQREYRDLWVIRFDANGRCLAFEEWPFWPDQARIAPQ
jgi:ketosteroid isomerase-like protein